MTEEHVFLAALDLPDAAARDAYLNQTCGADTALRRQVEALLANHFRSGEFLDVPVAEQIKAGPRQDRTVTIEGTTAAENHPDDESEGLEFLTRSTRADSLGRIGHYEVLQVLGRGGFGIVFRAFDDILQRVVAVKVMAPQLAATSPARKRFLREARTSAQVRHENVVQVYEVAEHPLPYLAMEFIPGETLQQRLNRTGPLEVTEVLRIGRQIADGLAAAHATDLIHRDIKPSNVLIEGGPQQRVKITDFGLARAADDASISQSGIIAGTPMYMAPEQALGQKLDQRADLFSLGSVLYQMAAGRPPFRANSTVAVLKRVAEDTPRDIREVIPETPQWLCNIISKLHEKNPDERYQSAREAADVLADCEAQLKADSKLKDFSRIPRGKTRPTGWRKWAAAAAVLLLPMIALAVTEFAGVTHLFRGQQSTTDPITGGGGPQAKTTKGWHGWPADAPSPAVAPFDAAQAQAHQEAWANHLGVPVEYTNSIGMKLRLIPPGTCRIKPDYQVTLTKPFRIAVHEVTVAQFRAFVETTGYKTTAEIHGNGHGFGRTDGKWGVGPEFTWQHADFDHGDDYPVGQVSWTDALAFCEWLSRKDGRAYRLPTEAEWEWACRAGSLATYHFGDDPTGLPDYAWFAGNSDDLSHPVGTRRPNAWGLFDMHGNIAEFCSDWFAPLGTGAVIDPRGPLTGTSRVIRGNGFPNDAESLATSIRSGHATAMLSLPHCGFRVVCDPDCSPLPPTFKNGIGMEFVKVPKGKSWLGGGKDKLGDKEVEIPADFYLGKYEVTQEEWQKVMGENPSHFSRTGGGKDAVKDIPDADVERFPVEQVSWDQCQLFVAKLNKLEKEKGWVYRLPTADEWEYACRGGPMSDKLDSAFDFCLAEPTNTLLPDRANTQDTGLDRTCKVGSYPSNRLGLFDMHGNVSEFFDNPWEAKGKHVMCRGGTWNDDSGSSRLSVYGVKNGPREVRVSNWGLRLARVPSGAPSPSPKMPFTDADVKRITALPAEQQVEEVRKELVRRNPGFDGTVGHKIEDGVVTEFKILTDTVTDIAPIRVFNALQVLDCRGTWTNKCNGLLADLTPLKAMNLAALTHLGLGCTKVTDAGMVYFKDCKDLKSLLLDGTTVTDTGLAHFKDCKDLTILRLDATRMTDTGLAHFKDCKDLRYLNLSWTKVSDVGLVHFKECKDLTSLLLSGTQVSDAGLTQFKGIPLRLLWINTNGITDLSPLQGMALEDVRLTPKNITRGLDTLRDMKSLKTIGISESNAWPAAEFWERYDKGEFQK